MTQESATFPLVDQTTVFRVTDDRFGEGPCGNFNNTISCTPVPVFDGAPFASMGSLKIRSVDPLEELFRSWSGPLPFQQSHVIRYDGVRVSQHPAAPSDFMGNDWSLPLATPQNSQATMRP